MGNMQLAAISKKRHNISDELLKNISGIEEIAESAAK
jgi:hypothetical protein